MDSEIKEIAPNKVLPIIYAIVAGVLTVAASVIRYLSLLNYYDRDIGYYQTSAITPVIFHALCIVAAVLTLSAVVILPRSKSYQKLPASGILAKIGSVFISAAIATHAVSLAMRFAEKSSGQFAAVDLFCLLFALGSIVYFLSVFSASAAASEARVFFGYCVILYAALTLAITYFDFNTTMNSPNKLLMQVAFMTVMVYMLCELRFRLNIAMPRAFVAFSAMAAFFTIVTAVPGIIAFVTGIFTKTNYLLDNFVCLGFGIYIAFQSISFLTAKNNF